MSPNTVQPQDQVASAGRVHGDMTVNECVQLYPQTLPAFQQYGIDTCCGGARQISDVAQRHGIDADSLLEVLNWAAAGLRIEP